MTTQKICYQKLLNLHQPGGESTLFDVNNPNKIYLEFIKGGLFESNSYLEGRLINLSLNSKSVVEPGCLEPGCVEGGGIWTTAITSNLSRVVSEVTQYWIPGSLDIEGNLWVLDLGIVDSNTGKFVIQDKAVSINNSGYFKSRITISRGIKLAILKKVTPTQATTVLHYFGEYKNKNRISRSTSGYLLNYNATDQKSELEFISLSLLPLLFSTYKDKQDNEVIYYLKGEIDYRTKVLIEDNIQAISNLLDYNSINKRLNSIPKELTTYLTPDILYTDDLYLNNNFRCVDTECIESGCLESTEVFLTSSREVSTRAIAWFYILIYTYTVYLNNNKYIYLLDLLAYYLENQIDSVYNLPSKGWTHSNVLAESTEILEYNLSTSVVTYIALSKHYNYTKDSKYLNICTQIHNSIDIYLYNFKSKLYINSLNSNSLNLEEYSYGLLFANITNKADVVESLISHLENNLVTDYGVIKESLVDGTISLINKLSVTNLVTQPSNINYSTLNTDSSTLIQNSYINFLSYLAIELSEKLQYNTSLDLQRYNNTLIQTLDNVEQTNNIVYLTFCLTSFNPFELEVIAKGEYQLTTNLLFNRSLFFNKLLDSVPLEFSWFSQKAISLTGNLYKVLKSISSIIDIFGVHSSNLLSNNYLSSLSGYKLNEYLAALKLERLPQETDEEVLTYIKQERQGNETKITRKGIFNFLTRYNILSFIEEVYQSILRFNSDITKINLGEGYYSGNTYASTNVIDLTINKPVIENIVNKLKLTLPIATKLNLKEVITLDYKIENELSQCLLYSQIRLNDYLMSEGSIESTILQELGFSILDEAGEAIKPENSTLTITEGFLLKEDGISKFIME